jgi:hypothetical protein
VHRFNRLRNTLCGSVTRAFTVKNGNAFAVRQRVLPATFGEVTADLASAFAQTSLAAYHLSMTKRKSVVPIFMRTAITLAILYSVSAMGTEEETLPTDPSVKVSSSDLAAAKQLQVDIRSINSKLTDPAKQKITDVSDAVQKYIPTGSTLSHAEALMLAMDCKPPLRRGLGQSAPKGWRLPACTAVVTVNPDKSRSLSARIALPGRFLQGHWLTIDAEAVGTDRQIASVKATIDIRTPAIL